MSGTERDHELIAVAVGIFAGTVFTDRDIPPDDIKVLPFVFLPLIYASEDDFSALTSDVGLMYEYKANSHSEANGYPVFNSMQWLTEAELAVVDGHVAQMVELFGVPYDEHNEGGKGEETESA